MKKINKKLSVLIMSVGMSLGVAGTASASLYSQCCIDLCTQVSGNGTPEQSCLQTCFTDSNWWEGGSFPTESCWLL